MRRPRFLLPGADGEVDLVPLIDCVFLLLLFFMLCGNLSLSERVEQISVPPALTAQDSKLPPTWRNEVINLHGGRGDAPVRIILGTVLDSAGQPFPQGLAGLREVLDRLHAASPTYQDVASGLALPRVRIELRADGDVPWRALQEVQQVLADVIDPLSGQPRRSAHPFTNLAFSVRGVEER